MSIKIPYLSFIAMFLGMSFICFSCDSEDAILLKDIAILKDEYPEGKEEERGKAVGLSYSHGVLVNFFIKRALLTPEEAELMINPDGTINMPEFRNKFFRGLIVSEQLVEVLKKVLDENPSFSTNLSEVKTLIDLLQEESGKSSRSETEIMTILNEGLRALAKSIDEVDVAKKKFGTFLDKAGIKENGEIDPSKIEKKTWELLPLDYPLNKHNEHRFAYMYFITRQPSKIDITKAYNAGDFKDVQFECEAYTGDNKDLRYLYTRNMCASFIEGITSTARKYVVDFDDARGRPNNATGLSYCGAGGFNTLDLIEVKGALYYFGVGSSDLKLFAFNKVLDELVHNWVYTDGLTCDQILDKLKTLKSSDI